MHVVPVMYATNVLVCLGAGLRCLRCLTCHRVQEGSKQSGILRIAHQESRILLTNVVSSVDKPSTCQRVFGHCRSWVVVRIEVLQATWNEATDIDNPGTASGEIAKEVGEVGGKCVSVVWPDQVRKSKTTLFLFLFFCGEQQTTTTTTTTTISQARSVRPSVRMSENNKNDNRNTIPRPSGLLQKFAFLWFATPNHPVLWRGSIDVCTRLSFHTAQTQTVVNFTRTLSVALRYWSNNGAQVSGATMLSPRIAAKPGRKQSRDASGGE